MATFRYRFAAVAAVADLDARRAAASLVAANHAARIVADALKVAPRPYAVARDRVRAGGAAADLQTAIMHARHVATLQTEADLAARLRVESARGAYARAERRRAVFARLRLRAHAAFVAAEDGLDERERDEGAAVAFAIRG